MRCPISGGTSPENNSLFLSRVTMNWRQRHTFVKTLHSCDEIAAVERR
jgi:hypothetical protein